MERYEFPLCCGATVLAGFGHTDTAASRQDYTMEQVDTFLTTECERLERHNRAMVVATINQDQKKVLGKIFEAHGFRTVTKAYHPNHQSTIYLLVKNFNQAK